MKSRTNWLAALCLLAPLAGANAALSDTVTVRDGFYGDHSITIDEGAELGDPIVVGGSAIFGQRFDLYFLEPGTGLISDHLFSRGGAFPGIGDDILFSSDGMNDPVLGTACDSSMHCLLETGLDQDVTAEVRAALPDPSKFCGGGGVCQFIVRSDLSDVPEPTPMALLGLGLVGLMMRRRSAG